MKTNANLKSTELTAALQSHFKGKTNPARIKLVERFVRTVGKDRIDCLVADRAFVGQHWPQYPNDNNIRYHIRVGDTV